MKKLKLDLEGIKMMLTKDQMKKVRGGYDNNNCGDDCHTASDCAGSTSNCPSCDLDGEDGNCVS